MAKDDDPYRTLGLTRGAPIDEVRRAYRRLAKANHPDVAGEKALPRFLAIQSAYQVIIGGGPRPAPKASSRPPTGADADRAGATHRAYGARARRPRTSTPGSGGTSAGSGGTTTGGAASGGAAKGGPASGSGAGRRSSARSGSSSTPGSATGAGSSSAGRADASGSAKSARERKATLGSTSYDGVEGAPFEPDWAGASWYGTTSGTYWTLNPKEYADPRKHGPEYQARARRAAEARAQGRPDPTTPAPEATIGSEPATPRPEPAARPTHTTSSWWESTTGPTDEEPEVAQTAAPGASGPPRPEAARAAAGGEPVAPPPDVGRALGDLGRALLDERSGGWRGRLIRAVVGWLPLALAIGWVNGEMTGCSRFAATCDNSTEPLVLVAQVLVLGLLIAVPIVASVAAMASIMLAATAVAATLALSAAGSEADAESRRIAVGSLLVVGWLAGLVIGIVRRVRDDPAHAPPPGATGTPRATPTPGATGTTGTATAGPTGPADPARPVS